MKLRNFASAAAALSLVAAPVAAQERTTAPVSETSEMAGAPSAMIVLLGIAAIIAGVILIGDSDGEGREDLPTSA
ncbi:hypothetical protein [Altererythrobacter sp. ZODW24]|uniref:hypothetical protein n=1 Tax=Altererythrobacter sp. ZODW24 TaxID=2185142 RepID=UPI000DF7A0FB|nr:hypothetical protein [Altererythrobacter sp. ZODW24]